MLSSKKDNSTNTFHASFRSSLRQFLPSNRSAPALIKSHDDGVLRESNQEGEVTMMRVLITFCVGVFTTLAWQSYGDTARERIAVLDPELSWLAPRAAVAETDTVLPASASLNQQELKTISLGLAAVRQKVDQLAADQQQIARDFTTKLQAAEQGIRDKISGSPPQAAPVRKPLPSQAQAAPVR